jgi:hypothetical protein
MPKLQVAASSRNCPLHEVLGNHYAAPMTNKAKSSAAGTKPVSGSNIGRVSDSGKFVVVKQATKSGRFSDSELKKAVRKVIASKAKDASHS